MAKIAFDKGQRAVNWCKSQGMRLSADHFYTLNTNFWLFSLVKSHPQQTIIIDLEKKADKND